MSERSIFYDDPKRGNAIRLKLTKKDEADPQPVVLDLGFVTRVELFLTGVEGSIDSAVTPAAFDWDTDSKVLEIRLSGLQIPIGTYGGKLVIYSVDEPDGLVWTEQLPIECRKG